MKRLPRLRKWITRNQWPVFIIAMLAVALTFTSISLWLYRVSGAAKLDLSRPGYEKVREAVKDDSDSTKPFPPTGNLDAAAIADFRSRYQTLKTGLDRMNNFDSAVMSDENLGLGAESSVTGPME